MTPEDLVGNPTVDPEVGIKKQRRHYSAEYRRKILIDAAGCKPGELGGLLRKEGLYGSHLSKWRRQWEHGELAGLTSHKRGPKADVHAAELIQLHQQIVRLNQKLARAELIMAAQKKLADVLGLPTHLPSEPNE